MGCEGMVVAPISYNQLIKKNKNKKISQLKLFFFLTQFDNFKQIETHNFES